MTTKTHAPHKPRPAPAATALAVETVPINGIRPAAVNDEIYKRVRADDPAVRELAESIRALGVLDPLLVTTDGVILSGHRRHAAARLAGLTAVPVIFRHDTHSSDPDFAKKLVEANRTRDKTADERIREAVAATDPAEAHAALRRHREDARTAGQDRAAREGLAVVGSSSAIRRNKVSAGKQPMLDALEKIVADNRAFWPLTLRQCHYRMLNTGVLRHAKKPGSKYVNDDHSYDDLGELLGKARLTGVIPWHAITDPTRSSNVWGVCPNATPFIAAQLKEMFAGYYRDLLQSQDFYLEVVVEKLTAETFVSRASVDYTATYSVTRGYPSLDALHEIALRFEKSGKSRMKLLVVSDFDPEGEDIARAALASLRHEFGIADITAYKVALTAEQVRKFRLPPNNVVKGSSSRAKGFIAANGKHAYELEALEPAVLQSIVADAIGCVIDRGRYDAEVAAETTDAATIAAYAARVKEALGLPAQQ